jgi:hypothetical protein
VIEQSKHKIEVDYPDAYTLGLPERKVAGIFVVPKDCPTLYQVAERRFPRKWDASILTGNVA